MRVSTCTVDSRSRFHRFWKVPAPAPCSGSARKASSATRQWPTRPLLLITVRRSRTSEVAVSGADFRKVSTCRCA